MHVSLGQWLAMLGLALGIHAHAKPVIFDTDMAIDDWAALLYLAKTPALDIRAITIAAAGESHCKPGLANAAALLDLAGQQQADIPIACGDRIPLDGYNVFPKAWRDDSDTLSGVAIANSRRSPTTLAAADVIHQVISHSQQPLIIVATGPLTNIARWLQQYPQDKAQVEQLVIMGGAVNVPGNIIVPLFTAGHPNTKAEWNIFIDPLAADQVFASALPITLVGLDVTNKVKVTPAVATHFKQAVHTPAARFWDAVLDKNDWFIQSGEYYFWDTLAAMIAAQPTLCKGDQQGFRVERQTTTHPWLQTSNLSMAAKRWDGQNRHHLNAATAGTLIKDASRPKINVCRTTQPEKIFNEFRHTLNLTATP